MDSGFRRNDGFVPRAVEATPNLNGSFLEADLES
jgi:hypothetical protein